MDMHFKPSFSFTALIAAATTLGLPETSHATQRNNAQLCSLGAADVGQLGTLICKDVVTGVTTQSIPLGATVSAAGGIGGSLVGRGDRVLVTNQVGGAILFKEVDGYLKWPVVLQTDGEGSLSGDLTARGAYVVTGTLLRFFPHGHSVATSVQPLLLGDGSASEVTLTDGYAYVAEKNGSLEAVSIARDGNISSHATAVSGISAGVIVGITGNDDTVVAPIAHLASNANQAEISVVDALTQVQKVQTKEVAACWTNHDDGEACVSNPGSMTVSCGRLGSGGFESYTSAAANPVGESIFDLDMRSGLVGIQGIHGGVPVLLTYSRAHGDFLTLISEFPVGTATAAGALLIAPSAR
jgi:hypothetical protein